MKIKPTVLAGDLKGSKLDVNVNTTRPLTSRVKQSIFDTVRDYVNPDSKVLDLYAGSGSFGIEALSRGVEMATFVERDKDTLNLLRQNLSRLGVEDTRIDVRYSGAASELKKLEDNSYTLIFVDAPFDQTNKAPILESAEKLVDDGILIWKIPTEFNYESVLGSSVRVRYKDVLGSNTVLYLSKK